MDDPSDDYRNFLNRAFALNLPDACGSITGITTGSMMSASNEKALPTAGTGWLKLEDAQRRYSADPNAETRAEFRRLLRLFADLVVRDQLPPLE
jgi:hypothetical protein